ncbi:MAG: ABC transporter ATP-binding protein [Lachnospiraceae bacterium]|nr:ABC transporter ATP-binding protein [Lachnospiraceae bacterium]
MEHSPAIDVNHISKVYRLYEKPYYRILDALGIGGPKYTEHAALRDVSFQVGRGECVGIIGTNGSGKSTILKIITGVVQPTEGKVTVDGRISALLELGAGFNMEYNGIENVYLNGTMLGFSEEEIKEKLPSILDFADIGDYVYQPVKTYSSGMFVRLAFAVAINIDPEILIVDEALSVGDVFFQAKCYHKFEEFKQMGKTIVFVSHDLSSIQKYCDRVILLNQGDMLGEGSARDMIDVYKRVLVGQYQPEEKEKSLVDDEEIRALAAQKAGTNPHLLEYGTRQAKIVDFYITDEHQVRSNAILKGTSFTIHMQVEFYEHLSAPIFAFSFKNIRGTEITGTNSMVEKAFLEPVEAGDVRHVTFTQKMSLQGGEYLLSLGLTGFAGDEFQVYHRLYDVINVTVVSEKDTVGFYDMDSTVTVTEEAKMTETSSESDR